MRSMGATTVLAIMPARPPARRLRISLGRVWILDRMGWLASWS